MLMHTVDHYWNIERDDRASTTEPLSEDQTLSSKVKQYWERGKQRTASVWQDLRESARRKASVLFLACAALAYGHASEPLNHVSNQVVGEKSAHQQHIVNLKATYSDPEQLKNDVSRHVQEYDPDAKITLYTRKHVFSPDQPYVGKVSGHTDSERFVFTYPTQYSRQVADGEISDFKNSIDNELYFGVRKMRCVKDKANREVTPDTAGAGLYGCNESYPPIDP